MLKNPELLHEFDREWIRRSAPDFREGLKVFEALYREALLLGALPPSDPLDGIEVDIRLARALNV